jgi:hypothetical protein
MEPDEGARQIAHAFVDVFSIAIPPRAGEQLDNLADRGVLALGRMFDLDGLPVTGGPGCARLDATNLVTGALSAISALLAAASDATILTDDQLVAAWREELDR